MKKDNSVKQVEQNQQLLMLKQRIDRLERWIKQIADKTGIKLEY